GWIGPDAKSTAPAVVKALADKNDGVRRKAAFALGRIAPGTKDALPALITAFSDPNEDVRAAASEAVGKFGTDAVGPLVEALKEKKTPRSIQAARALAEALKDDDEEVRRHCAQGLQQLGQMAKLAAPKLKEALVDMNFHVRMAAYYALASMNEDPTPLLRKHMKDGKATVRIPAAALL